MSDSDIRDKIERAKAEGNAHSVLGVLEQQVVAAQMQLAAARQVIELLKGAATNAEQAEDHAPGATIETLGGGSGSIEP